MANSYFFAFVRRAASSYPFTMLHLIAYFAHHQRSFSHRALDSGDAKSLAHRAVDTLAHRTLTALTLALVVVLAERRVLLLGAAVFALVEDAEVLVVGVLFKISITFPMLYPPAVREQSKKATHNQILRRRANIRNQPIQQIKTHTLPHHDPQNLNLILIRRQRVVGNNILLRPQQVTDILLFDVRKLLLELITETEGHNWQTGVVVGARFVVFAEDLGGCALEGVLAFLAVDVGHTGVPAGGFEGLGEEAGVGQAVLHDGAIAGEAEVD